MSEQQLFQMMKKENLTTLSVVFNPEKKDWDLCLAKEWTKKIHWAGEEQSGFQKTIKRIFNEAAREIIQRHQMENYINSILHLVRVGRHALLELLYDPIWDACCVVVLHKTSQQNTVGTIRRSVLAKSEMEVITEALNLARFMTFRAAAANLPYGGACLGFHAPQSTPENEKDLLGFLTFATQRYRVKWGIEGGFTSEEVEQICRCAPQIVVNKNVDTIIECIAYSVFIAAQECLEHRYGDRKISGKIIGIEGLGKLGKAISKIILQEGADLIVADMNAGEAAEFEKHYSAQYGKSITVVSLGEIRMQMGHLFIPASYSGTTISRDTIPEIKYHIVVGGANHVLQANTVEEELHLANRLLKSKVLYLPDWIANIGGVICATEFLLTGNMPPLEEIKSKIDGIVKPLVKDILEQSKKKNTTPLEEAYQKFNSIVYESHSSLEYKHDKAQDFTIGEY